MDKTKIRTLLIDDEITAIDALQILLEDYKEIEVAGTALSVDEGLAILLSKEVDIVFLDIRMPEKGGFELLHELQKYQLTPVIIFTTAFDKFAIEAIRHSAFDYLLKPIDRSELTKAIRRYQKQQVQSQNTREIENLIQHIHTPKLRFATRTGSIFIHPDEIIYIQAEGNYSELLLVGGKKEMVTMYLKEVFELLSESNFYRIGRSSIINLKYLTRINRKKRICELDDEDLNYRLEFSFTNLRDLENYLGRK